MTKTYKIKCENVSKVYDLNVNRKDKLLSLFTFGLSYKSKPYYALHDISFEVEEGTSVGIIGLNGSGKSTLSNILGGVVEPSSGTVYTNGKPSLIAIGAGLNPEFTGEENIHYKCLMHGMTQRVINEKFDDIVQFSELDEFIYQPLKSYSSGMKSRLGFAIAIHTDPDILIVDEALSVGDETFSNKCIDKMHDLQEQGKTIFFVSHSAGQIKKMCKKAIWIHYGEMVAYGEVNDIVARYVNLIQKVKKKSKQEQLEYKRIKIQQQRNKEVDDSVIQKEKRPTSLLAMIGIMGVAWIYILLFQVGIL
ncbi:ABC transporter ATP-binding protein [Mammaliicoccus sciuri]|nr:ABC transporter ATP-binding protein [Mammaliicoccus sciuri]MBO1208970.1 ABC transporter ATP-binding protein [Mammaliicoccus sciuri]MCD5140297.1 ABC transporter ATP-binding protein [Mammaliicoccus sciuri]MEB8072968.1 ABC transporter ATP-binding protein [Mammaliicoccus sciuri]WQL16701.1 ABC transporter ATP-binding protein [Mammaliicoccus sciuri]